MSFGRSIRSDSGAAKRVYGRKVCRGFTEQELFELPVAEKLVRMTVQRTIQEVIADCDIAFCPYGKLVEGMESIMADDPLKAALDHARKNDVTCFVQYDKYYGIVPSFKSDMKGWSDAFKLWDQMQMEAGI